MLNHNPDVLDCLANLSSDEVFTPPKIVNAILDMLPQNIFENPDIKFLDPCCKSGIFLREIAKRLIKGLENKIPDLQERLNHIYSKQLFGIAITELTSFLSRRTVYCSKIANGGYSICKDFKDEQGNIKFKTIKHTWENGKCKYCGASQEQYDRGEDKETHAYEFIHLNNMEEIFKMKFDVIIGNPPYQLNDGGGTGDSAKPIYHLFIEQAKKMNPRFITMIVPSRWMKGGKGLDNFRKEMINDLHIKEIHDFFNASECFPRIALDGGVNYFLWDKDYNGKVDYYYKDINNNINYSKRFLKTEFGNTIIRDFKQISIIEKVKLKDENSFSSIVSARNPFGFFADFFNNPEKYKNIKIYNDNNDNNQLIKIYGIKGKKGGSKRVNGYIENIHIYKNIDSVNKYKLFFSKAYMLTSTIPPEIIIGKPNEICTETFLQIGSFNNETELYNCLNYIKTKFFRALLFFNRDSLNISRDNFNFVPIQNWDEEWTDEKLYKKYNLNQEEIKFIEEMIKDMN